MAGLFDKIKKRAGRKEQADAQSAAVELQPAKEKKSKIKKADQIVEPKITEEKKEKKIFNNAYRILIRPVVSEKASVAESFNAYSFVVAKSTTKGQIKEAVEQIYGFKPKKVRIVNVEGKELRVKTGFGRRSDWKKAIVTLVKGQTINVHEGV